MDDTTPSEFLTFEQFAAEASLSVATVRRRVADGSLRAWQPGGKRTAVRIHRSELPTPCGTTATTVVPSRNTTTANARAPSTANTPKKQPCRRPNWQRQH